MSAADLKRLQKMAAMIQKAKNDQKKALAKRKSRAIKKTAKSKKRTSPIGLKALGFY